VLMRAVVPASFVALAASPSWAQDPRVEIGAVVGDAQYSNQFELSGGLSLRF
jgi:hypothetical protein